MPVILPTSDLKGNIRLEIKFGLIKSAEVFGLGILKNFEGLLCPVGIVVSSVYIVRSINVRGVRWIIGSR